MRALHSGVSRGTETIVFRGAVPEDQYGAMRAPHQEGDFPAPVKYGYLGVGVVEEGPPELVGTDGLLPAPAPDGYVVPVESVVRRPRRRAGETGRARGHGRDGRQRALGRGAAGR